MGFFESIGRAFMNDPVDSSLLVGIIVVLIFLGVQYERNRPKNN
jgi:hypothetical protein